MEAEGQRFSKKLTTFTKEADEVDHREAEVVPTGEPFPIDETVIGQDLPLLSNTEEVIVSHYLLQLRFCFRRKVVTGTVIYFIKPRNHDTVGNLKGTNINCLGSIIFDSCYINVTNASVLRYHELEHEQLENLHFPRELVNDKDNWFEVDPIDNNLSISQDKWSVKLSGSTSSPSWTCKFPTVVRIEYETLSETPSLHWRPTSSDIFNYDEAEILSKCVYTPASPINNRGLFPCQDAPTVMATWECFVIIPTPFVPLLTSDAPGMLIKSSNALDWYYFYTNHVMPISTFAIVIGVYPVAISNFVEPTEASEGNITQALIPVRLFSLNSTSINLQFPQIQHHIINVLSAAFKILGPHPFSRLDIVILPRCFHALGLANPYMIFLSPSVFTGDLDPLYLSRIPHEISHSWFGLSVGALDWSEEWLSEGFATFLEDVLYKEAILMSTIDVKTREEIKNKIGLKKCLRLYTLQNELENTDTNLQILVPEESENISGVLRTIKNGLVAEKQFTQVHYLKGYFFLEHLSSLVGQAKFLQFLKIYVHKFVGELVTSMEFLNFYTAQFPSLNINVKILNRDWLQNPKLVDMLANINILNELPFFNSDETSKLISRIFYSLQKQEHVQLADNLNSFQLILLFEKILKNRNSWFRSTRLENVRIKLKFVPSHHNPEVLHRWCELIVKFYITSWNCRKFNKAEIRYTDFLKKFLLQHPAMGVYLFGELMISEIAFLQEIACSVYQQQLNILDPETRHVLHSMLS